MTAPETPQGNDKAIGYTTQEGVIPSSIQETGAQSKLMTIITSRARRQGSTCARSA